MNKKTLVYLITGFLGSGKTTFLKRIIDAFPKSHKLMVLMNEFGDVGVDAALLAAEDLEIHEISRGSIFCVCVKTDFIKALMKIARELQPDVLLIEATGVANPSDLKKDLELSIFQNRFQLKEQFCMIDAENFEDMYATFTSLQHQLETSSVFIINKVDQAGKNDIRKIRAIVEKHHPDPICFETTYGEIPLDSYLVEVHQLQRSDHNPSPFVTPQELETTINNLLKEPHINMTPPDRLLAGSYTWRGAHLEQFEALLEKIPKNIVRAKGFPVLDGEVFLFNWVMGVGKIEKLDPNARIRSATNQIAFIGSPEVMESLGSADLENLLVSNQTV